MGKPHPFSREKLVVAVLISREELLENLIERLQERFGSIDYRSKTLDFDFTHYYDAEMGLPIRRFFVSFDSHVMPDRLASIKVTTIRIEEAFAKEGRRKVNLDPGLLSLSRFILASTKDGSHRIPLGKGIFGEITLRYERGAFHPLPWTYPDYRSRNYLEILEEIRELYRKQIGST